MNKLINILMFWKNRKDAQLHRPAKEPVRNDFIDFSYNNPWLGIK